MAVASGDIISNTTAVFVDHVQTPFILGDTCVTSSVIDDSKVCPAKDATPELPASSSKHLFKRSPVSEFEKKLYALDRITLDKADYHHEKALRYPQGHFKESSNKWVLDGPKSNTWSNRQNIVFNKDHDGALQQIEHNRHRLSQAKSRDARKYNLAEIRMDLWKALRDLTRNTVPLYKKHTKELINHLHDKLQRYQTQGNYWKAAKWQDRLSKVTGNDVEAIKSMEKDYHTKVLKAKQNKKDWMDLYRPDAVPFYPTPPFESYSTPDKKSLHLRREEQPVGLHWIQYEKSKMDVDEEIGANEAFAKQVTTKTHQPAYLPDVGHATNRERIENKIRNAESEQSKSKWMKKLVQLNRVPLEYRYGDDEVRHYHNKEVENRWNQLHYASAARFAEMGRGKQEGKRLASDVLGDEGSSGSKRPHN